MNKLPLWVLTDRFPSVYESESATAIEMVSKLYGAMREIVEEYNIFAETNNSTFEEWLKEATESNEAFRVGLRQEFQDFIDIVELKHLNQDKEFEATIKYFRDNIYEVARQILLASLENSTLAVDLGYDAETEALTISFTNNDIEITG